MNGVYKSYTNILFVDFARESKECQTERLASSLHLVCSVLMVELPTRQWARKFCLLLCAGTWSCGPLLSWRPWLAKSKNHLCLARLYFLFWNLFCIFSLEPNEAWRHFCSCIRLCKVAMWFDWRAGDHGSAHGQPRSHIYTKCNCRIPAGIFGVPRCFQLFGRARHSKTTWLDTWWFAFCYGSCSLVAALVVVGEVASEVSKVMVE